MSQTSNEFTFGIKDLDFLFKGALVPGTTLLIAGHPGAGKTTFSATICYNNALEGKPCLYLSFQESKEKFENQMLKYRMDFRSLEEKKLFKFVRLPVVASDEIINVLSEVIGSSMNEIKARLLVLDSATPISETLQSARVGRSIFQNFFYDLSRAINGLVIIVEELPLGMSSLPNSDLEFVADAVILMKHVIKNSLLVRSMEFRKFRGAPLTIAEVPFSIREKEGLTVFVPRQLESVPPPRTERKIVPPCKALERSLHELYPGSSVLLVSPSYARSVYLEVIPVVATAIVNGLTIGVISYKYSRSELLRYLDYTAKRLGIPFESIMNRVKFLEGINPTAFSIEELMHIENRLLNNTRPDVVIFHSPEHILLTNEEKATYYRLLYNQLLLLRGLGILTVRMTSYINEEDFSAQAAQSEAVIRISYIRRSGQISSVGSPLEPELFVWRSGFEPRLLYGSTLQECFNEMKRRVREKVGLTK